jgi:glycosyltransferase involved in cell wall biosynthesis
MCAAAPSMMPLAYRLARLLADIRPTLIHANGLKMHVLGAWVSPATARLVWHVHDYVGRRPIMSRLLRLHARRCACILANSNSVADDIRACVGVGTPVLTVHNAIDVSRFSAKGAVADLDRLARMPPAPKDCLRIGMPATMARWKGHRVFLKALSMLPRSMPLRGYVIGGPLYATYGSQNAIDDLRRCAIELGIEDRVGFTGFIADAPAATRALDVVVHASTEPEPFGLIIAEAMACEKPIIATAAGGAMEIVSDGNNAIAYPPGDADALAAAITRLASDAGLRARLGAAGRKTVESRFTREHLANRITPIYRELAASDASFEPLGILG